MVCSTVGLFSQVLTFPFLHKLFPFFSDWSKNIHVKIWKQSLFVLGEDRILMIKSRWLIYLGLTRNICEQNPFL